MGAATILLEVHSFGMQLTNHTHIDLLPSKYLYISIHVYIHVIYTSLGVAKQGMYVCVVSEISII